MRLLAAERLSALPVLHFDGSIYELLDVGGLAGAYDDSCSEGCR